MKIIDDKIYFKLVFAGTALAGKTTALQWIFDNLIPEEMKLTNKMRSIKTSFQQTLMFDFVPIQVSDNIFFRLYASTGQDYYARVRELLSGGVDGIFFIVDSQKEQLEYNRKFLKELFSFLNLLKHSKDKIEVLVLYNKIDLPDIYDTNYLTTELKLNHFNSYATSAITGHNLKPAFQFLVSKCLEKIRKYN